MRLHEDAENFSELVQVTAENIGLPQVYVEKDYWVTKALKHLSESAHGRMVSSWFKMMSENARYIISSLCILPVMLRTLR